MKRFFCTVATVMLLCTAQTKAQLPNSYTARLQTVLDSVCNKLKIRGGVSAAVLVPNIGLWKGVYGNSHIGTPITSDMQFGIGSNTKTYISTAMLLLEEQNRLSIDDTIGKWIINQPNVAGSITIRQLLNHTSGLFDYTQHPNFQDSVFEDDSRIWQPEEVLPLINSPYFAPGTRHDYSNTNYLIAGLIIKRVMNQPLSTTLRSNVLTPQGFANTIFFPDETPVGTIASPWSDIGSGSYQEDLFDTYNYSNNSMFSFAYGAGAIMATAEDNVQFWHKLISGAILSPASMSKMFTYVPVAAGSNIGYGLGIYRYPNYLNGRTIYSHGGTNVGYINENAVDSVSGVAITVLTNQDSISNAQLLNIVVKALHKVTLQMPTTAINETQLQSGAIRCYPNPAHGLLTIDNVQNIKGQLLLTDMTGRVAASLALQAGKNILSVVHLASGIYHASVIAEGKRAVYIQQMVIQ